MADITADLRSVLLVDRQPEGTTADFIGVSSTRGVALGAHASRWGSCVSAITFVRELGTGIGIALAHAVVDTFLNGHAIVGSSDGECASSKIITIDFRGISIENSMVGKRNEESGTYVEQPT